MWTVNWLSLSIISALLSLFSQQNAEIILCKTHHKRIMRSWTGNVFATACAAHYGEITTPNSIRNDCWKVTVEITPIARIALFIASELSFSRIFSSISSDALDCLSNCWRYFSSSNFYVVTGIGQRDVIVDEFCAAGVLSLLLTRTFVTVLMSIEKSSHCLVLQKHSLALDYDLTLVSRT
jgi:hypothetical protein